MEAKSKIRCVICLKKPAEELAYKVTRISITTYGNKDYTVKKEFERRRVRTKVIYLTSVRTKVLKLRMLRWCFNRNNLIN